MPLKYADSGFTRYGDTIFPTAEVKTTLMRKHLCSFALLIFVMSSCSSLPAAHRDSLPPGQAKKVDGAQSARDYAPGRQKKVKNTPDRGSHPRDAGQDGAL